MPTYALTHTYRRRDTVFVYQAIHTGIIKTRRVMATQTNESLSARRSDSHLAAPCAHFSH